VMHRECQLPDQAKTAQLLAARELPPARCTQLAPVSKERVATHYVWWSGRVPRWQTGPITGHKPEATGRLLLLKCRGRTP
jgi:hypothetical protein